jgi:hypothetical protein
MHIEQNFRYSSNPFIFKFETYKYDYVNRQIIPHKT